MFYTHSDTEVIVHLYDRYGDDFVQHLNGQFAIALWDRERQRLVLARDRAGIRPLFYARDSGRIVVRFGGEGAACGAAASARALDPRALAQTLTYWSPVAPGTAVRGRLQLAARLPAGDRARWPAKRSTRYWDWTFPERRKSPSRYPLERGTSYARSCANS